MRNGMLAAGLLGVGIGLGLLPMQANANRCHQDCFITWRACVRVANNLPEPERTAELTACTQEKAACDAAADQYCPEDPPGLLWKEQVWKEQKSRQDAAG